MRRHLAVFDWNGTLLDDLEASLVACNEVFKAFGCAPITLNALRHNFTFPLIHFYTRMGIDTDRFLKDIDRLKEIYLKSYNREVIHCSLRSGAAETLKWLNARGWECMVLSNHVQSMLEEDLRRTGVYDCFQHISGNPYDADISRTMNKHERLKAYMEGKGYAPSDCFITGDSFEEIDLGRDLGLTCISVKDGFVHEDRLQTRNPDYLISDMSEISSVARTLENEKNY